MVAILKHGLQQHAQGILLVTDRETGRVLFEGNLRQCIHCQNTWTYKPGSDVRRGFCVRCNGNLCGRPQCDTCYHKERRIEDMEAVAWMNKRVIEAAVRQQQLRKALGDFLRDRGERYFVSGK